MATAIKAEHLSKAYQLGDFGTGTISRDLERFWARIRGKEDPFLKIGESNDRTTKGDSDIVWSLKDLDFEIEQGDAVGVIGRNGAGKSTLLKILSRVTSPTTGSVKIKGRIASLLEVGTGFHPELTGKENIFLNGAILGMRRAEIKRKFDEIVDFAGVERYIDTPVKRYSSGMYVRLAFAVAAHLESEILIVDEVLAVGDAEFQKKCLGKMGEVSRGEGRTILFVSHNMASIQSLCSRVIQLHNGAKKFEGGVQAGIQDYYGTAFDIDRLTLKERSAGSVTASNDFAFKDVRLASMAVTGQDLVLDVEMIAGGTYNDISIGLVIANEHHQVISTFFTRHNAEVFSVRPGSNHFTCTVPALPLAPGTYTMNLWSSKEGTITSDYLEKAFSFEVEQGDYYGNGYIPDPPVHGSICIKNLWANT